MRQERRFWWHKAAAVVGLWVLACGMGSSGPALVVGSQSASTDSKTIEVPLTLRTAKGYEVVAIHAALEYDEKLRFQSVEAGPAAMKAKKEIAASSSGAGHVRFVIFGVNRNAIDDGVVATIRFELPASDQPSSVLMHLSEITSSDAEGQRIALQGVDGRISLSQN